MLLTYPVFKRWRCSLCPTRCSWDPTKHLQSLCSKCARPTRNWRAWTKIGEQCQRRTALCFFVVVGLRKREILRNQFLQTDFTLLNGERNQFYSSTKGKLFRVVSWRKCMVGMFGGVKLGGGGKLVMGEVCRIRMRKLWVTSLKVLPVPAKTRLTPVNVKWTLIFDRVDV